MRATAVPAAFLVALWLGGCSVSVDGGGGDDSDRGDGAVSASDLADEVQSELRAQNPDLEVDDVTCDGGLEAEEGAEQVCHGRDALDDLYRVAVMVTGVEDDNLSLNIEPDPGRTVAAVELEPLLSDELTELSGGTAPDAVDCPDDLPGRVDATTTCILTAGQDRLEVAVTVTSAEGPDVEFDIEVADEPLP